MKSTRTLTTIVLLIAATTATLIAQNTHHPLMKIDIPFAFTVDNHTMPAGRYYVTDIAAERTIALVNADGKHSLVFNDLPNYGRMASPDSRMVFQRYGSEYFLVQVWTKGETVARNPFVSKRVKELAQNGSRPEDQVILAYAGR